MTVSIRYGILGPIESSSWFVKAVASNPNSEIVALACEKTKEKQNLINVPVFESYSELCQSPDVDAIFVPTSNTNHYEGAKLAPVKFRRMQFLRCDTGNKVELSINVTSP